MTKLQEIEGILKENGLSALPNENKHLASALLEWHNEQCYKCNKQLTPDEILNVIDCLSPGPPFAIGTIWTSAQIKIIKRKLKEALDKK